MLGEPDDPSVVDARQTVTGWIVDLAQDQTSRAFLVEKLEGVLEGVGARTWGEGGERLPAEKGAGWLVSSSAKRAPPIHPGLTRAPSLQE